MKNYGQSGVSTELEFGKNGTKIKNEASDQMSVLQQDGLALSRMKGANPVDAQDFVTKAYLENKPDAIVTGEIVDGSPAAGTSVGERRIVSVVSGTYPTLGALYYWDGSAWVAESMVDGLRISVSSTISQTGLELQEGHVYVYDATFDPGQNADWVDVGPSQGETNLYKAVTVDWDFNDQGTPLAIGTIPAGAIIDEILVSVDTVMDGTAPLIEVALATDGTIMADTLIDEAEVGLYQADFLQKVASSQAINISITGTGATTGAGSVLVKYKN